MTYLHTPAPERAVIPIVPPEGYVSDGPEGLTGATWRNTAKAAKRGGTIVVTD
jgi:hypothetical protein